MKSIAQNEKTESARLYATKCNYSKLGEIINYAGCLGTEGVDVIHDSFVFPKKIAYPSYPPAIANNIFDKFNKYPADNQGIISILMDNPFLFMDAIVYYIEYEKLSYDDKQELKRTNSKKYVEQYMRDKPITDKQIKMLEGLGYNGPFDISRLGASNIIEELIH